MKLLQTLHVGSSSAPRRIELLQGDLTRIPDEHSVDVLVVSAFRGDYAPTHTSLVGALDRAGVSIRSLAQDKLVDLCQQFSCWLSKPLVGLPFRHILCIESGWKGSPPQITDDLFRALAPYLVTDLPNSSVAMPIIGTGDQGYDPAEMLDAILNAAVAWIKRGLPLNVLKIIAYSDANADAARRAFAAFAVREKPSITDEPRTRPSRHAHDVFLSYSRKDSDIASYLVKTLQEAGTGVRVFFEQTSLREGDSWAFQLATALDASQRVVTLYSKNYWDSRICQLEFLAAFARQIETGENILFPIYLSDVDIPHLFRSLQYTDCRVGDREKVARACGQLVSSLAAPGSLDRVNRRS